MQTTITTKVTNSDKNYGTGNLKYGVNTFIGKYAIVKMRVSIELWKLIENYFNKESIEFSRLKLNTSKEKEYMHFQAVLTFSQLSKVKIITRERKIRMLNDEILNLTFGNIR